MLIIGSYMKIPEPISDLAKVATRPDVKSTTTAPYKSAAAGRVDRDKFRVLLSFTKWPPPGLAPLESGSGGHLSLLSPN